MLSMRLLFDGGGGEGRGEESWLWCNLRYDDSIPMYQAILECASDIEVFDAQTKHCSRNCNRCCCRRWFVRLGL